MPKGGKGDVMESDDMTPDQKFKVFCKVMASILTFLLALGIVLAVIASHGGSTP